MVRFLVLYPRPTDEEAFLRHYHGVHVPLAQKVPGVRRYSSSRDVRPVRGDPAIWMVAELEWDDADAMRRAFESPEGRATAADVEQHLARWCPGVHSLTFEVSSHTSGGGA